MSDTKSADRSLEGYPPDMRASILRQRAELKARQQSGEQRVGPWAPAARLAKPVARKKVPAAVTAFRRRA